MLFLFFSSLQTAFVNLFSLTRNQFVAIIDFWLGYLQGLNSYLPSPRKPRQTPLKPSKF